ncbi:hypothetical protein VP1G_01902 [Cytospora mali]|uniref:MARVEL domain-containing protein n=1 Tax=Cytospora mali TaxID=578113 RepID=A0A194USA0_CYTMA|nr:hypothetical protein VP1G_01902 [Valsa mali var. pyri (nom. inval.)]
MAEPSSSQAAPAAPAQILAEKPGFEPFDVSKTEPFKPSKTFGLAKLILGCFNLGFAIIAFGLSLGLEISQYDMGFSIGVIIVLVTAGLSIVWQLAELITIAARKSRRPIHPGAHIALHLIILVLCILVVLSTSWDLSYTLQDYTIDDQCDASPYVNAYYEYCEYDTFPTQTAADKFFHMMEALIAFTVLMTISHFTLWIMACIEADRRRKYGRKAKVVYLVANQGSVDGRVYYTPILPPQGTVGTYPTETAV